jgi:hypothetical protein
MNANEPERTPSRVDALKKSTSRGIPSVAAPVRLRPPDPAPTHAATPTPDPEARAIRRGTVATRANDVGRPGEPWRTGFRIVAVVLGSCLGFLASAHAAVDDASLLTDDATDATAFPLVVAGRAAELRLDAADWPGVLRAAGDLQSDIARVTSIKPSLAVDPKAPAAFTAPVVIAGTLGHSALIDDLVAQGKIDARPIAGKWESFLIQVIPSSAANVAPTLVIAGSDKRGTIYGLYELSEQIGVSPWLWWADVPVRHRDTLRVRAGRTIVGPPAVKYRGIFLNDEAPSLTGWAGEKFGGLNSRFYAHVFELLLRLRANYLWPAMWNNAFNEDDPANPKLADEYGIVMGTSHHEPMLRAQQEWKRHGHGPWNYATNGEELRRFWADGVRRNRADESIVTVGMRGDGDMPMSRESNVALLERIVADQRAILAREVNPDVTQVPQLWALYKEVQDYYEKGMRVPDDVTLLWCDDNWGNIRRLPTPAERSRSGGAGIYYHFDYVGTPRNYKWLATVPLPKIWEQMHLAWRYGADRIWIVNVGDLKPMEYPISFFLRYAWDPATLPYEKLGDFSRAWAAEQFGPEHAAEIAALLDGYTKLNGRRKPELLAPDTFSLLHYREAGTVLAAWHDLETRAGHVAAALPADAQAAFFQLVQQPIEACRIVNELEITAGRNALYATQGRASTNALAAHARDLFAADATLTARWDAMLDGKWRHMMDQTHLGYTTWQQPVRNVMPAVADVQVPAAAELAVATEGDPDARPGDYPIPAGLKLPALDFYGASSRWFDVFNRGTAPVHFTIATSAPWLKTSVVAGDVGPDVRVEVSADWAAVPVGETRAHITVSAAAGGPGFTIDVPIDHRPVADFAGFVEADGAVVIEAPHFQRSVAKGHVNWKTLPDFGPRLGGVTTFPVTAPASDPARADAPRLEYDVCFRSMGEFPVTLQCAPSLDFQPGEPLRLALSVDDAPPEILPLGTESAPGSWDRAVSDGVRRITARVKIDRPGAHVLKVWRVTPGIVLERIVIDTGGVKPSYLGPPESRRATP